MGVVQSTVAELVPIKEHQSKFMKASLRTGRAVINQNTARAYTIMPSVWSIG